MNKEIENQIDMTMHGHQLYRPMYSRDGRNCFRNYIPGLGDVFSEQFKEDCTSVDRRTFGSLHLLYHLAGVPEDDQIDLAAVQAGVEAFRWTHQNTQQAWHEIEAQQPHIVSLSFELDYSRRPPSPGYLSAYYNDKKHSKAQHDRTKVIGSLLATDRIMRSWHQDMCCSYSDCLHNNIYTQRPVSVPEVPLRSVLSTVYDDQLSTQHWFRDVVARHVSLAFDNLSPKERETYWHNPYDINHEPSDWWRENDDNQAKKDLLLRASRYAIMFADSYALVMPGVTIIRGGDEMPPRSAKGSY